MTDKNIDMAVKIASLVSQQGGTAYFVGGYVRDRIRHKDNKDIDIEIHGIYPHQLESILDSLGERISIGESFGIYNLKGVEEFFPLKTWWDSTRSSIIYYSAG